MQSRLKLTGLSVQPAQLRELCEKKPQLAWIEISCEEFIYQDPATLKLLETLQQRYPISLHCQGLSLGSTDQLNWHYLKQLKELSNQVGACLISDHLAWTSYNGQYFHSLLPLPYNNETRQHLSERIQQVQDYLQQPILLENIPHYQPFIQSDFSESAFLSDLARETGCKILLDINALYVSSCNINFNSKSYINELNSDDIQEIHLSGFSSEEFNQQQYLVASRNRAILPAIWHSFQYCTETHGSKATIIEWNQNTPTIETLCLEAFRAESIMREIYAARKLTG